MVNKLSIVQFLSEIILVISNQTCAAHFFNLEIMHMISDQIALHAVQLPFSNLPQQLTGLEKTNAWDISVPCAVQSIIAVLKYLQSWDNVSSILNKFIEICHFAALLELIHKEKFKMPQLIRYCHILIFVKDFT